MREALQTQHMSLVYEMDTGLINCTWSETTSHRESVAGFAWLADLMATVSPDQPLRGCIMDFSNIVVFAHNPLDPAKPDDPAIQALHDTRHAGVLHVPTAIIVKTLYQEMFIRTAMRLIPPMTAGGQPQTQIVRSREEGLAFIEAWHTNQDAAPEHR